MRFKIPAALSLVVLVIFALPLMPQFYIKAIFTVFFMVWAVAYYLMKVKLKSDLVTDGVWWIPYFLVIGLEIISISGKHLIILNEQNWEYLVLFAFLIAISAILFFWEWPPWFFVSKNLISKGKRILLAYVFFIPGLLIWMYGGMCLLNTGLDQSTPVLHDCDILDRASLAYKYKGDTRYIILVKPRRGSIPTKSFFVSSQDYQRINSGPALVRIWTKTGFFHFEWVSGIKILTL